MPKKADLSVEFLGFKMKNPFMLSSSPVSNSAEMVGRAFDAGWGGVWVWGFEGEVTMDGEIVGAGLLTDDRGWVNMGTDCGKGCAKCGGRGTVNVRLTEDPAEQWVHDYGHHGWLIVGTIE